MTSLVTNFQKDVLNPSKGVTDILRTAKVISAKLGLGDIEHWINAELNGYPEGESVPPYRQVWGTLEVRNPYRGWIIVTGGSREVPFYDSMPQIEQFSQQKGVAIQPRTNIPVSSGFDSFADSLGSSFPQRIVFTGTVFKGMIEAV